MPIFEYLCGDCGKRFEAIVLGSRKASCPECSSDNLKQQLSTFAARTESHSAPSMPRGAPAGACGSGGGT